MTSQDPSYSTSQDSFPSEAPIVAEEVQSSVNSEQLLDQKPKDSKKIVQVMLIYEDDTFRTIHPVH